MDNGSLLVADSYYVVFRYLTVFHSELPLLSVDDGTALFDGAAVEREVAVSFVLRVNGSSTTSDGDRCGGTI